MKKYLIIYLCFLPWGIQAQEYLFNDVHFHLTNYIQEGTDIEDFYEMMKNKVGRVALFGIPLQQQWSFALDGNRAPKYYLNTDAELYYYSFTDAFIAQSYLRLSPEQQKRFDPMITGFNPTDMYAADHIKRVLLAFPGVFSGVGEFSIHKEFVSAKIAGTTASLKDEALDRIFEFCQEVGLVMLIHCDIDVPFPPEDAEPVYFEEMKEQLKEHKDNTVIWAHTGLGRIIRPHDTHIGHLEELLDDPELTHLHFDISWDEVAKYMVADEEATQRSAELIMRHPDRFLFGTDVVAPKNEDHHHKTFHLYDPLWELLDEKTSALVRYGNYNRIFDEANTKVRAWEEAQLKK